MSQLASRHIDIRLTVSALVMLATSFGCGASEPTPPSTPQTTAVTIPTPSPGEVGDMRPETLRLERERDQARREAQEAQARLEQEARARREQEARARQERDASPP